MEILRHRELGVVEWGLSSSFQIEGLLEDYRERLVRGLSSEGDQDKAKRFSRETRMLSEMELCHGLRQLTPPQGFELTTKQVRIENGTSVCVGEHTFFSRKGAVTEIICLTPGQLVSPFTPDLGKGDRVRMLMNQAGELVHRLTDEVVMLHGTKNRIRESLHTYF